MFKIIHNCHQASHPTPQMIFFGENLVKIVRFIKSLSKLFTDQKSQNSSKTESRNHLFGRKFKQKSQSLHQNHIRKTPDTAIPDEEPTKSQDSAALWAQFFQAYKRIISNLMPWTKSINARLATP